MKKFYCTKDNILVDIQYITTKNAKRTLILWPCGFGDVHSGLYEIPTEYLQQNGCNLILYNPRGHGKSQGFFSFADMVNDLASFIYDKNVLYPLVGVGHSIGGAGLLTLNATINIEALFLFSPILSSRESVEYMYKISQQFLFAGLFCRDKEKYDHLWNILAQDKWLDKKYWKEIKDSLEYPLIYDTIFTNSIRKSMEEIAHPGHNVYATLEKNHKKIIILIPQKDLWFPINNLVEASSKHGIVIATVKGARNHFFKRKWGQAWQIIINKLLSDGTN